MFGAFAALAVVLALVGLYGVLSYVVAQRRQEIGTRMALGASRAQVAGLFLKQGAWLTAAGLAFGLSAAIVASRWLSSLLFGVTAHDPASFATVAVILLTVGAAASYLPARRAAGTEPMTALRTE
ncbi:MAG TPA: FtsX-like permease family protein [Vicinamibacterales bacterium]|nr:FtsX-like permease family protein [Vicinamibacterales bacterium]